MARSAVAAWITIAIGFGLWLSPPGVAAERIRVAKAEEAMGTTFSMVLYGADRALESATATAFEEVYRLDQMLSNYCLPARGARSMARRRYGPSKYRWSCSNNYCLDYSRMSGGTFDITVGPLMKVSCFYKGEGLLPRKAAMAEALRQVGYHHIHLDRSSDSVRFDLPGVELDPGGVGKGRRGRSRDRCSETPGRGNRTGLGRRQQHLWNGRASRKPGGLARYHSCTA